MKEIESYLKEKAEIVNSALDGYLQKGSSAPDSIVEAMRYAVFAGGKRLRPILAISSCEALGGNQEDVMPAACALELIHTYSLIHDDLPSMDNDDFRRGKPTTHKAFGEAAAILAGDALLTLAFEVISKYPEGDEYNRDAFTRKKLEIIKTVSSACGTGGLIGGQVRDLQLEGKDIGPSDFETLHLMKTSALIEASLISGAIMADADAQKKKLISDFGKKIGLAFQIADDLLDAEGKSEIVGKKTGKDHIKKKATYPSFYGIRKSHTIAEKLIKDAKDAVQLLGKNGKMLSQLAEFIITRTK